MQASYSHLDGHYEKQNSGLGGPFFVLARYILRFSSTDMYTMNTNTMRVAFKEAWLEWFLFVLALISQI